MHSSRTIVASAHSLFQNHPDVPVAFATYEDLYPLCAVSPSVREVHVSMLTLTGALSGRSLARGHPCRSEDTFTANRRGQWQ